MNLSLLTKNTIGLIICLALAYLLGGMHSPVLLGAFVGLTVIAVILLTVIPGVITQIIASIAIAFAFNLNSSHFWLALIPQAVICFIVINLLSCQSTTK